MLSEKEIGKILSSQLFSIVRDSSYCYTSSVPGYSHLTDDGKRIMSEFIDVLIPKVVEAVREQDKDRAEKIMMENLKNTK